jgi:hypothetical protein
MYTEHRMVNSKPGSVLQKSRITRDRWQLDEKCIKNTKRKSGSIYSNGQVTFATRLHLAAVSTSGPTEIVDYSRLVAAGRELYTEH